MSYSVDQAFVTKFAEDFHLLASQTVSRLEMLVNRRPGNIVGEAFTIETLGTTEADVNRPRHSDLTYANMAHVRRYADMRNLDKAELVDSMDKLKLLADPMNAYSRQLIGAVNRQKDKAIIDAALNPVRTASGTSALPASSIIAPSATGLTLAKIIQAKGLLDGAEMDDSDFFRRTGQNANQNDPYGLSNDPSYVLVIGNQQIQNLLNDSTVRDVDYNSVKALVTGSLNTYMGFKIIRVADSLLPKVGTNRYAFAFAPRAINYGIGLDTTASVDYLAHKDAWQILAKASVGAGRSEDAGVIRLDCVES